MSHTLMKMGWHTLMTRVLKTGTTWKMARPNTCRTVSMIKALRISTNMRANIQSSSASLLAQTFSTSSQGTSPKLSTNSAGNSQCCILWSMLHKNIRIRLNTKSFTVSGELRHVTQSAKLWKWNWKLLCLMTSPKSALGSSSWTSMRTRPSRSWLVEQWCLLF